MVSYKKSAIAVAVAVAGIGISTALAGSTIPRNTIPRNTIHFISFDDVDRIIAFTSHAHCEDIEDIHHKGGENFTIEMPQNWGGTVMAKKYDAVVPIHRVQAEIQWQGFEGKTHYDASAITNHTDNSGIRFIYPAGQGDVYETRSGCTVYPCDNAYLQPDDEQTKVTYQTDMVIEIGVFVSACLQSRQPLIAVFDKS
ncbi:putative dnase1 protein [Botrytis fragariae]|uniref:Putative dnase1 protein n=1 Tax=Botrytis fragariae TaxID=1964551 RepID=A0A8H6EIA2_9HELO|nr:putative dnase1 protein [Botrytis fragariae]KAF5873226.1 putative dnase1 protein [Botrytis fragariae]